MSHHHLWVRVEGFGLVILPRAIPFEVRLEPDDVLVVRSADTESRVAPGALPGYTEAADLVAGNSESSWCIQTTDFELPFPASFKLVSADNPNVPPGFDLVGPAGEIVYFQGPGARKQFERPDTLIGPGETVLDTSSEGPLQVCVTYQHADQQWWQIRRVSLLDDTSCMLVQLQASCLPTAEQRDQLASISDSLRRWRPAA